MLTQLLIKEKVKMDPNDKTEMSLPESVKHININDKDIYLVATAHVSKESVNDVEKAFEIIEPDSICVELCASRFKTIQNREHWKKMNIFKVIREGNSMLLLTSLIMSAYQKNIGSKLDINAGAEMLKGIELSKAHNKDLVLADRDVQITLKRTWRKLTFYYKIKMFFQFLFSIFSSEEIDEETIKELKEFDQLENILKEFAKSFPQIKSVLIDERDIYLSEKIKQAPGKKVMAILGAGHVPGILKIIEDNNDLEEITKLPSPSKVGKIVAWTIPAIVIGLLIYGFFNAGFEHSMESIYIWVLINGALSAIGALIAFGHPVTVLSAFIAAPLTSLNPMIAAGWVSGLVQAWIKKPTVQNLEDLPEEILTIKGFWHNPVTRVLLVVCLSNLGSAIGTFISGSLIAARTF